MSVKAWEKYQPNAQLPSVLYPYGALKKESALGLGDGSPLDVDWGNDFEAFKQTAFDRSGLIPSGNTDTVVNSELFNAHQDATTRKLWERSLLEAGYNLVGGSFEEGGTLTTQNDVLWFKKENQIYVWGGLYPKVVPAGSTPASTGVISVTGWTPVGDITLRQELASSYGAGLIGFDHNGSYSNNSVGLRFKKVAYDSDQPFNIVGVGDKTTALNAAIDYCAANGIDFVLTGLHQCSGQVNLHGGVKLICLNSSCGIDSTALAPLKALKITGIGSMIVGGQVKGINNPASTTIRQDGVELDVNSAYCEIVRTKVFGFYAKGFNSPLVGMGIGVQDFGVKNRISSAEIVDSKFCLSLNGQKGKVFGSYIGNHYLTQTVEPKPWTDQSNFWDGIAGENATGYEISGNIVEECGQSGIYLGGNGGLSVSNKICGNHVSRCWNRGIDNGVNQARSTSNDVIDSEISHNTCTDNRENNLWFGGVASSKMLANTSIYTSEYNTLFAGHLGAHVGIGIGNGAVGAELTGNLIDENICIDPTGNAGMAITEGVNNTIGTNNNFSKSGDMFIADSVVGTNTILHPYIKSVATPNAFAGAGTITLDVPNSPCRYTNKGKTVNVDMLFKVLSVAGNSGTLSLGPIPGTTGKVVATSNLQVTFWDNLNSTTQPLAALDVADPSRIIVYRADGGRVVFDMGGLVKAGSAIRVTGDISFF